MKKIQALTKFPALSQGLFSSLAGLDNLLRLVMKPSPIYGEVQILYHNQPQKATWLEIFYNKRNRL